MSTTVWYRSGSPKGAPWTNQWGWQSDQNDKLIDAAAFEIDPALPAVGPAVVLCGYPGNSPSRPPVIYQSDVSRTVTVSGVSRIEIDKPVHPGSSGGPLLSALTGKVLGVVATFKKGDAGADAAIAIAEISRLGAPK